MTESDLHSLLRRQISKYRAMDGDVSPPLQAFIKAVDEAYKEFDRERSLVQRSMDLSSHELMQKNESLRQQTEKMARLNTELDDFAFAVAHDLREPLRSIVSYTQLLKNKLDGKLNPDEMEFFRYVVSNVKKMDVMLTGMTRYADIHVEVTTEPVDLKDVINIALHQLAAKVQELEAMFIIPSMPVLNANRSQLIVLFRNLFQNSLNNASDAPLTVEVSWIEKADCFEFTIKDNGAGIRDVDPNKYLKLFKKVNQLSDTAGMGLAVCKKIVLNHGGNISISSNSAAGLQVNFTLSVQ